MVAAARPGLSEAQFERLIDALKHPRQLTAVHRELTQDQAALDEFFRQTLRGVGMLPDVARRLGLPIELPAIDRDGRLLLFLGSCPAGTTRARIYLTSGVVTLEIQAGATKVQLPESVCHDDRVVRVEFLARDNGAPLAVLGGEPVPRPR
jgi:hypothetical protein